jgi:(5-formylfuran-3-yl)methyl phosphate synthase
MRLLVSVRAPEEAAGALIGGADIIDAKEPNRGSLGAVTPDVLAGIMRLVPPDIELSAAMGDPACPEEVLEEMAALPDLKRLSATYVKLGFAGTRSEDRAGALLETAAAAARAHVSRPSVIAVAYADSDRAGSPAPRGLLRVAARAGAAGLLLDTHTKTSGSLLDLITGEQLADLLTEARRAGLVTAVAGGLTAEDLPLLVKAQPHIAGFRGAACTGGRRGRLDPQRVQLLRSAIRECHSGFLQERGVPVRA